MEAAPRVLPNAAPTRSTEKVCSDSGTGVNHSGMTTWAVRPTKTAPPTTRAMLRTRPPGMTSARVLGLTLMLDMGLTLTVRIGLLGLVSVLVGACAPVPVPQAARTPEPAPSAVPATASTTPVPSGSPTPTSEPAERSCADLVARLSPAEQVGQLLMVAVGSTGVGGRDRDILADSRAGSVILLGNS